MRPSGVMTGEAGVGAALQKCRDAHEAATLCAEAREEGTGDTQEGAPSRHLESTLAARSPRQCPVTVALFFGFKIKAPSVSWSRSMLYFPVFRRGGGSRSSSPLRGGCPTRSPVGGTEGELSAPDPKRQDYRGVGLQPGPEAEPQPSPWMHRAPAPQRKTRPGTGEGRKRGSGATRCPRRGCSPTGEF